MNTSEEIYDLVYHQKSDYVIVKAYFDGHNPNCIVDGKTPLDVADNPRIQVLLRLMGAVHASELPLIRHNAAVSADSILDDYNRTRFLCHRLSYLSYRYRQIKLDASTDSAVDYYEIHDRELDLSAEIDRLVSDIDYALDIARAKTAYPDTWQEFLGEHAN